MLTREQFLRSVGSVCWYCAEQGHMRAPQHGCQSISCSCFACHGDTSQTWEAQREWMEEHDRVLGLTPKARPSSEPYINIRRK